MIAVEDNGRRDKQLLPPFLQVSNSNGCLAKYALNEGESVFAGSGSACRILLKEGNIAQFHCMFNLNDGRLWAQDCGTGAETSVNGTPLTTEIVLTDGDQIAIDGYTIVPVLTSERASVCGEPMPAATELNIENSIDVGLPENVLPSYDACLEPDWPDDSAATETERFDDLWSDPMPEEPAESALSQELELLRSEVEYLQSELALREAYADVPLVVAGSESQPPTTTDEKEILRLVNRLEELLAELQTSDERVRHLDDLLRASDEANQAEQEERRQLESWLNEIENRVSQREADMEADAEKFRLRCEAADRLRLQAEAQIKTLVAAGSKPSSDSAADANQTSQLQTQLEQQQRALESIQQENTELKSQLLELQQRDNTEGMAALEQKLACMELETSRERAEIARQRSEFESLRNEFDRKLQQKTDPGTDESRIAAMRQHLREIHEEEKSKELERKQNSLSGRISRLLNRV